MFFAHHRKKLLIIDDDPGLLRQVQYRQENHEDARVITTVDEEKGNEQSLSKSNYLFILGWMLPGIQGTEALKRLKQPQAFKNIPVLMLTGRNKIAEIANAFDLMPMPI